MRRPSLRLPGSHGHRPRPTCPGFLTQGLLQAHGPRPYYCTLGTYCRLGGGAHRVPWGWTGGTVNPRSSHLSPACTSVDLGLGDSTTTPQAPTLCGDACHVQKPRAQPVSPRGPLSGNSFKHTPECHATASALQRAQPAPRDRPSGASSRQCPRPTLSPVGGSIPPSRTSGSPGPGPCRRGQEGAR